MTDDPHARRGVFSLISWNRPSSYWDVVGVHLPLAMASCVPLVMSNRFLCNLLPLRKCTFLWFTGYPCPFCGFTRSFLAIGEGDWAFALHNCPLACLVFVAATLFLLGNLTALLLGVRIAPGKTRVGTLTRARFSGFVIVVLVLTNWAYRLYLGLQ